MWTWGSPRGLEVKVGKKQKKESERQSTLPHQNQDKTAQNTSVQSGYTVLAISDHGRIPD